MTSVVLGGGTAGLIWAFYRPEAVVLSADVGGAALSRVPLGPRYLHASPASERLVRDVGLRVGETVTVRARVPDTVDAARWYVLKTRGSAAHVAGAAAESHVVYATPTIGEVVAQLRRRVGDRVTVARVTSVDPFCQEVTVDGRADRLAFGELISTVPLPDLAAVLTDAPAFGGAYVSVPIRFDVYRFHGRWPWDGYEYAYVGDPARPYSRISRVPFDGVPDAYVVVECAGVDAAAPRRAPAELRGAEFVASQLVRYGRVVSRPVPPPALAWLEARSIRLFGRFAEWDDGLLTHHLAARVQS